MAGHQELIKKLSEDDALRQQILDTPSREGKHELVRKAGLTVPDHDDVLEEVAGGTDVDDGLGIGLFSTAAAAGALAAAAAAAV